jgi:hypothetical protein
MHNGKREPFSSSHAEALQFATAAADRFEVKPRTDSVRFDASLATAVLALKEDQRKKLLRQGPVTKDAILKVTKQSAKRKAETLTEDE